ncbi:ROK family protein [Nocardia sp. NPDC058518]|uniref:ROK family protein n=1 Tax=Nocardia sp. NPDC058518 TaxID=3346534 RepID=UPI00365CCC4D
MANSSAGAVLRAVLDLGSAPRSVVARHAGVSPATVTWQSRALVEAGLLVELPESPGPGGVGRPHSPIALDAVGNVVIAVHIAAVQITVAVVDIAGSVLHTEQVSHRTHAPFDILDAVLERVRAVRSNLAEQVRIHGLGVAIGGRVDTATGSVVEHSYLRWRDVPVREYLSARTGLPVSVDSHTRATVHAEQLYGRLRGSASSIVLFVGNVIDAAIAVHGRVHYGPHSGAGSIARLLGTTNRFALDALGDHALLARAETVGGFPQLVAAAAAGGPERGYFIERATVMGEVAAALIDLIDPEALILIDRGLITVPGVREAYDEAVRAHSTIGADPAEVIFASTFPGQVLVMAAAGVVMQELFSDPLSTVVAQAV